SWNPTLQRVLPPLKVQTPRLKPVSSPETLSPNPKRSPLWGLPFGKNSAFFTEVPTRCSDFGAGAAVPTVACIAIAPSAASTATSASIDLRDSSLLLTRESSLCISHLLLPPAMPAAASGIECSQNTQDAGPHIGQRVEWRMSGVRRDIRQEFNPALVAKLRGCLWNPWCSRTS